MIGGTPDEVWVDLRADKDYNVDFYFRAEKLEYRLVLTREQLAKLCGDARTEMIR